MRVGNVGEERTPGSAAEVERVRRDRLVGSGAGADAFLGGVAPRLVMVADLIEAIVDRLLDKMVDDDRRAGKIVEQRLQPLVEEGQPVLHAGEAAAFAYRLVERIGADDGAEGGAVILPEAADRLLRQDRLACRHEVEARHLAGGALAGRVEGADRLQRIAEEIEADRRGRAGRPEVDDAAAHGVLAEFAHRRGAVEAVGRRARRSAHPWRPHRRQTPRTRAPRRSAGPARAGRWHWRW